MSTPREMRDYAVYGLTVRSEIPLTCAAPACGDEPDVTFTYESRDAFAPTIRALENLNRPDDWYERFVLADGSELLRWPRQFQFLISADGRRVICDQHPDATLESFQTYLLGHVLSFVLIKLGEESLHATALDMGTGAIALLGGSGDGKSTLAAALMRSGAHLLTDDLLRLDTADGSLGAWPGPRRLKLFPTIARQLLPGHVAAGSLNADSSKLIVPFERPNASHRPIPLAAFLLLDEVEKGEPTVVERISGPAAVVELAAAAFNRKSRGPARLRRQFEIIGTWAARVPLYRLAYPRELSLIDEVVTTIAELCAEQEASAA